GRRDGEELVRTRQIASELPRPVERPRGGRRSGGGLRRPGLLSSDFKAKLAARARDLGFDACRITAPDAIPDAASRLAACLAEGAHGDMEWMARTGARRADPRALWPQVRSIVMLGM